jgi:hypothetical protein
MYDVAFSPLPACSTILRPATLRDDEITDAELPAKCLQSAQFARELGANIFTVLTNRTPQLLLEKEYDGGTSRKRSVSMISVNVSLQASDAYSLSNEEISLQLHSNSSFTPREIPALPFRNREGKRIPQVRL